MKMRIYWSGSLGDSDDFGQKYKNVMYDAKTKYGPWANMTHESWLANRHSKELGLGRGQKYEKQLDGGWLKVEG